MAQYPILGFGVLAKLRVHLVLALVQVGYAGFQLLTKVAFEAGLNKTTYPVYRNVIGFGIILPFAAYYERKERPKLSLSHVLHFFLLGLTAVAFGQGLYLWGLGDTSPTFASAFQNSIPALTFIIAAVSGIEDAHLGRRDGQAKLLGAICAGVGATLMTAYKGPVILQQAASSSDAFTIIPTQQLQLTSMSPWRLGSIYLLISCVGFAVFYVLQAKTLRMYPARYSTVCFTNFFGAIQLSVFAMATEPTISIWKVKPGIQLASVLYAGFVASGLVFSAQAWCMQQAGPVIVSAYQPLQTVVVGIISLCFLGESFYLGSILGALLIIVGLYLVTYGQEKQQQHFSRQNSLASPNRGQDGPQDSPGSNKTEDGWKGPLLSENVEDKLEAGLQRPLLNESEREGQRVFIADDLN